MDYGDLIGWIIFGFVLLTFMSGFFGRSEKSAEERRPARPTELAESGGQARPVVIAEPAGPVAVFADTAAARPEARREPDRYDDLHERLTSARKPLEQDLRDTERELLERDITDMPTIAEELDPEHHPRRRRRQELRRRRRIVEGGDVLRRSLRNPETLERGFIVKEVLDRPLALRDDR